MKGKIGALAFILVIVALGWVVMNKITTIKDFQIALAFGFPKETEIEMHTVASMGMTAFEGPMFDPKSGMLDWQGWVDNHFDLRDAAGQKVTINFIKGSDVVKTNKLPGVPEGFLFARVKQGGSYTFDYVPKMAGATRFRYLFTAPTAEKGVEWCRFDKV